MDVFGEGGNIKKSKSSLINKLMEHSYLKNYLIISSFLLLAILSELLIIHVNFMTGAQDIQFHWQRIEELHASIQNGNWLPQFALNQFNYAGSAVMVFYPYLTLIPITLLSFIIKSHLALIFTTVILITFIMMIVAFYSSLSISKSHVTSYLFSAIYGLSVTNLAYWFQSFDIGVLLTLAFLPLAIFGFIHFINNDHWMEMSIGITLVIFSHVLNSLFLVIFLIIWLLINFTKIHKNLLKNLLKSVIVVMCTTCMFWLPALHFYLRNTFQRPFEFQLGGTSIPNIFNSALSNSLNYDLNIYDIIGLVVIPLLFYKKFSRITKQMYWLSIGLTIFASNIIPWHLAIMQKLFGIIQFPWRVFIFAELLLDYIFAVGIVKCIKSIQIRKIVISLSVLILMLLSFNGQNAVIKMFKPFNDLTTYEPSDIPRTSAGQAAFKLSKSSQFKNMSYNNANDDYYLESVKPLEGQISHTQALYNVNKTLQLDYENNGKYTFNNNTGANINELNIPFQEYYGEHYRVYLDHHKLPFHANKSRLLTINNVTQGNHTIKIIPTVNVITRASRIISIIGVLLYIFFALAKWLRKIKISRRKKRIKAVE